MVGRLYRYVCAVGYPGTIVLSPSSSVGYPLESDAHQQSTSDFLIVMPGLHTFCVDRYNKMQ
eukprot:scaffold14217_cov55-Attheya_sp.AAC.2